MADITTVYTYPLDGTTTEWPVNFEYLARRFVVVTLIGQDRKELVLNTDYRFVTATLIQTTKAWSAADDYDYIEIRRNTSATDRVVTFSDGSILRAVDLNLAQVQTMHVAEEARNAVTDTIGTDANGNLDARARRIVNVADAVDEGDAINLRMMHEFDDSALNSANASAASAAASAQSANQSASSASASATSAANSHTSEVNSANSASASANSATLSGQHEQNASLWASAPEDQAVYQSSFSSYHYSQKSAKSATASATSASQSAASASASAGSASESNGYMVRAEAAAEKLENVNDFAASLSSVTDAVVSWKDNYTLAATILSVDQFQPRYNSALTFNGTAVFTGAVDGHSEVISRAGMFKAIASSAAANAHLWFYGPDESTRGIFYADSANALHIQAGASLAMTIQADGSTVVNGLTMSSAHSNGQIVVEKAGVPLNASAYSNAHIMMQTDDGGAPAISFHRGGSYALALYLSGENNLHMIDSAGQDRALIGNDNLQNWIANSLTADVVGTVASIQNNTGQHLGLNATWAGSGLVYSSHNNPSSTIPSGSWRSMGWANNGGVAVWRRYA